MLLNQQITRVTQTKLHAFCVQRGNLVFSDSSVSKFVRYGDYYQFFCFEQKRKKMIMHSSDTTEYEK